MITRRAFNATLSAAALGPVAACTFPPDIGFPPGPDEVRIDMHAHIFNARDVPAVGFLRQMVLRNPSEIVDETAGDGLFHFLEFLFGLFTRSAEEELENRNRFRPFSDDRAPLTNQRRLARAIDDFAAQPRALGAADPDAAFLAELDALAPPQPTAAARGGANGTAIAAAVYRRPDADDSALIDGRVLGNPSLASTLRWAVMMTRDRGEILGELIRLYGTEPGGNKRITVFSPSLLDLDYWLFADDQDIRGRPWLSPIRDQIDVMADLARRETDHVILNFAPFCPLRAAADADDQAFELLDYARQRGFAGVKLYPPVGFRPDDNSDMGTFGGKRMASGKAIDDALERLYAWCARNDMPIKSHGNNTLAAHECSGLNASPAHWLPVIGRHKKLRVNVAHFGGFEETYDPTPGCKVEGKGFDELTAELSHRHKQLYSDLGFWTEATTLPRHFNSLALDDFRKAVTNYPEFKQRLMYGSDWSMIARLDGHERYLVDVKRTLEKELGSSQPFFYDNARRFLGLGDPTSDRYKTLAEFFGPGHAFHSAFPAA